MTMMDRWIDRHLKRMHIGQFLERAAEWLAGYLFLFGVVVLITKLLLPALWPHVLWLGLGVIPVTGVAWWLSRRNSSTRAESVAMLDRKLQAGGLLMTLAETPDEQWAERLPQVERIWQGSLPRYRPTRFARYLVLPVVFALATMLVPLREASTATTPATTFGRQASEELQELFELLDEGTIFEEEERQQLQEELERLAEESKQTPLTHEKWETVDALRDRMRMRLDTATLNLAKSRDAAQTLAKGELGEGEPLSLERTEQLEKDVLETLERLAKSGKLSQGGQELSERLERLLKEGRGQLPQESSERRQALADLQEFLEQEWEQLQELREQCEADCPDCNKPGGT